ncbi:hypothetical protein DFH07DRAFT_160964 [Mycena maculata]|uniref:Uncharacterized protein n=1 Tax=Mycena maculata TaxID=230809 RepID=A0AAD7HXG3_9AGAR|nr:hypothetical protein DFH07DRAFT_160964 [Mycena maculata]
MSLVGAPYVLPPPALPQLLPYPWRSFTQLLLYIERSPDKFYCYVYRTAGRYRGQAQQGFDYPQPRLDTFDVKTGLGAELEYPNVGDRFIILRLLIAMRRNLANPEIIWREGERITASVPQALLTDADRVGTTPPYSDTSELSTLGADDWQRMEPHDTQLSSTRPEGNTHKIREGRDFPKVCLIQKLLQYLLQHNSHKQLTACF